VASKSKRKRAQQKTTQLDVIAEVENEENAGGLAKVDRGGEDEERIPIDERPVTKATADVPEDVSPVDLFNQALSAGGPDTLQKLRQRVKILKQENANLKEDNQVLLNKILQMNQKKTVDDAQGQEDQLHQVKLRELEE